MSFEQYKTQVLLLHSQQRTLDVLSAGFNDRYSVHCATSGTEALNTLHDTPIHVIVSAQELPGMSGLEALREAKKRSPETIGILLAGTDESDGLEALVGAKEVFQVVRGEIEPAELIRLIENARQTARLMMLAESANDKNAGVDMPVAEHIVMETSEHGAAIISDGTSSMPALKLKPEKVSAAPGVGARGVDVLVLTKDEEFLATIRDSARGLHNIHHSVTPAQAEQTVKNHKIGVLVTDAAMVGSDIEGLTQKLRVHVARLVAIVAGRRDDGDMLMDLINRGHVYRFLLKPVSPGRARLAIEASVKHHLEAPDSAFKGKPKPAAAKPAARPAPATRPASIVKPLPVKKPAPLPKVTPAPQPPAKPAAKPVSDSKEKIEPTISASPLDDIPLEVDFGNSLGDDKSFTDTMTDIAVNIGKSISGARENAQQAVRSSSAAVAGLADRVGGPLGNAKTLGIAAAVVAAAGLGAWLYFSGEFAPGEPVADNPRTPESEITRTVTPPLPQPRTSEAEQRSVETAPAPDPQPVTESPPSRELVAARDARDSGRLIAPAGNNAIELYIEARGAEPDNETVSAELADVVNNALGIAESAILARNADEAANALAMVELADAANPRVTFLSAQLAQLQLRQTTEEARLAIRDGRFDAAGTLIAKAEFLAGTDAVEVDLLKQELLAAKNAVQAAAMISLAKERLEAGDLVSPANDSASYHFYQALEVDPENLAAQQGLIAVGSKLVLQARSAIDAGQLDDAEALLADARSIDPDSADLRKAGVALSDAREAVAEAARQAEAARLAEIERQAELARQAELERQAELARQAEAARQAELKRQADLARQAEEARLAEIARQEEAERRAAAARQAEIERQAEIKRQAEAARQAEAERLLAEQRAAEAAEAARIRAEQDAAKAATSSPLGVAAAASKAAPAPTATAPAPVRRSEPRPATSASNTATQRPAPATATATTGNPTTSQASSAATREPAPRQASVIGGSALTAAAAATTQAAANSLPEMVPVSNLKRTKYVAPEYPRSAQRRDISGSVDLQFTITTDGRVRAMNVLRSEPEATFDQAAMDAVTQWRFEPVIENGVAVEKRTAVRLAFNLED